MLALFTTGVSGTAFVLHAAGIMHYYNAFSYEKFIIDDEICGLVKKFMQGYDFDEEKFIFDDVEEVGSGGHYLYQESTLDYMDEFRRPLLSSRADWEGWKAKGGKSVAEVARDKWQQQLEEYEEPTMNPDMAKDVNAYISKRCEELIGETPKLL
jgi:trimethylamine--corrinoid protein Co-methyltransferase